jgi:hypothetical protein
MAGTETTTRRNTEMATTTTKNGGAKSASRITKVLEGDVGRDLRQLVIPAIQVETVRLLAVGLTPLIMHKFSEKMKEEISDKQTGKAKQTRAKRDIEAEQKSACYVVPGKEKAPDWKPGKYYFPGSAFKHAFLYGVAQLGDKSNFAKTNATGWVFVQNDPVLQFKSVTLRNDMARNPSTGRAMPTFRPQFNDWSAELLVDFNARAVTLEQVVSLFNLGGFGGGIGEWRPSSPRNKAGSFGRFTIKEVR